ncbi:uncharacterized protein PAC_15623 [Phialocephala subalpina]|uniref:Uncharacterized protein n=1 Tax=Phialocephala subalpina TaxID=576137 RepID=A0A1L7XL28_9HELO|nr:uncharacterized protein PAC_15623 [Phialocephala subalpina]
MSALTRARKAFLLQDPAGLDSEAMKLFYEMKAQSVGCEEAVAAERKKEEKKEQRKENERRVRRMMNISPTEFRRRELRLGRKLQSHRRKHANSDKKERRVKLSETKTTATITVAPVSAAFDSSTPTSPGSSTTSPASDTSSNATTPTAGGSPPPVPGSRPVQENSVASLSFSSTTASPSPASGPSTSSAPTATPPTAGSTTFLLAAAVPPQFPPIPANLPTPPPEFSAERNAALWQKLDWGWGVMMEVYKWSANGMD